MKLRPLLLATCAVATLSVPAVSTASPPTAPAPSNPARVTVYAGGFNAPRGLAFSPHGDLYVAEAGSGGTDTTVDICPDLQVPVAGGGPVMNGPTARISRVRRGVRSTVVDGLPSVVTTFGGDPIGVADVAFLRGRLYALIAGGGCSNGNRDPRRPNGVIRVRSDGSWRYVANLSAYYRANPVAHPDPEDYVPDGVPYDMVTHRGRLVVVEANSGVLDRVPVDGRPIRRIVDISEDRGNIVPTAVARDRGRLYVGNLGEFPIKPGTQAVYRVRRGHLQTVASGFTAILGIAFDSRHRLYVLESSTEGPYPQAGKGRIVRVDRYGKRLIVADGLNYPTAMTFGPDRALYVSVNGYNSADGAGQILRVRVPRH